MRVPREIETQRGMPLFVVLRKVTGGSDAGSEFGEEGQTTAWID
jgi:hypothetical protein